MRMVVIIIKDNLWIVLAGTIRLPLKQLEKSTYTILHKFHYLKKINYEKKIIIFFLKLFL